MENYNIFYTRKHNGNTYGVLIIENYIDIHKLKELHEEYIRDYGEADKYNMTLFVKWLYNKRSIYSEFKSPKTLWLS